MLQTFFMLWTLCAYMCVKIADAGFFVGPCFPCFQLDFLIFCSASGLLFIHLIFSHHSKLTTATFCPQGTEKSNYVCKYLTNSQIDGRRNEVQRGGHLRDSRCFLAACLHHQNHLLKFTGISAPWTFEEVPCHNLKFRFYGRSLKQDFTFSCFSSEH